MSSPRSLSKFLEGRFTHFSRWLKPDFFIYFKPVFLMAENRSPEPGDDADDNIDEVDGGRGWQWEMERARTGPGSRQLAATCALGPIPSLPGP